MNPSIEQSLVSVLGLDHLPPQEQAEALTQIGDIIFKAVMFRLADTLPAEQLAQLEEKFKEAEQNPDAVYTFLQGAVPDIDKIIMEETEKFKQHSADMLQKIRAAA